MNFETEQTYGTLELLTDKLSFDLPGHEDGGYIYPFVWEEAILGEFNIFNLCEENNWLKLTDSDEVIKSWRQLEYVRCFNDFFLTPEQIKNWESNIDSLAEIIQSLDKLENYIFQNSSYATNSNIILGQVDDNAWLGIAPTIYVESTIPHEIIARYIKYPKNPVDAYGEKSTEFNAKIKAIIERLGTIELNGDFGGGYVYSYTHKIVYSFGSTKELAFQNTLLKTGMLEVSQFDRLYGDRQYLDDWFCDSNNDEIARKYNHINQFMKQNFAEIIIYRLSSWIEENIYIIGQTTNSDIVGLYLKSCFVYNP